MMSEQAEIRGSGTSPALVRLARALGLLARMPARPLRRSGLPSHRTRRRMLVGLLVLALTAPLGMTAPFDARAEEDEAETTDPTTVEHLEGAPFWQVLRQHDEGDADEDLVRPWTKEHLNAVHFPSDEVGYAVGARANGEGSYGVVLKTEDGGDTWKVSRLRRGEQIGDLHGVHFVDDNFGFAVGEGKNEAGKTTGVILGTSDGGESWWQVESGVDAALRDVHFPTARVGYAVGDVSEGSFTILKTVDGGRSWTRQQVTDVTVRNLYSVDFTDGSNGVAVGGRGDTTHLRTILTTANGGDSWEGRDSSTNSPRPLRDVTLLNAGDGYAVGESPPLTVLRTSDGFQTSNAEPASVQGSLLGVTAYWATDLHPVVLVLEALESLLEEGPPPEVRDLVAGVLDDSAEDIEGLEVPEPLQDGPVEEALEDLATSLKSLAQTLRENEHWDEAKGEVDLLLETALEALEEAQEMRDLVASGLDDAAETIESLEVPEPADHEAVEAILQGLADGFREVAKGIRNQDAGGLEIDDELQELRAKVRTVHAVGDEADLPVVVTRTLDAQLDTPDQSAAPGAPAWAAEPIEDWTSHEGKTLNAVSASPGGRTVVAVGSGGLMLRRVATPQEAAESACLPRTDSAADEAPEEAMCPEEEEEPSDPEEQEPPLISPPLLTVSPEAARPGSAVTVGGENWVACEDPDRALGCQGVTVGLELRQGSKAFGLGQAESEDDGSFTLPVTVPEEAQAGSAIIHATGDPEPDGGPEAEAQFTVAAVTPVSITLNPAGAVPGGTFRVDGSGWHRCDGAGNCKGVTVDLEFRQDGETFDLGQVEAADNGGFTLTGRQVPEEAKPGEAIVRAVGDPAPDGGPRAQAAFDVFGECLVSLTQINPEFPCLTAFNFELEPGQPAGDPSFLGFDPGLGESGRAVAVEGSGSSVRVFLYDLDRLEQRGVPGFGRHFPPESRSARGHETGVVFFEDAGLSFPGSGRGLRERSVALDSENHRLYLATGRASASVSEMEILAISLIGEFPPASFVLQGRPIESITHLTVDGVNDVLYAATTSGQAGTIQLASTTTPQRDVQIRAIPVEVVGKGKNKKLVLGPRDEPADEEPVCLGDTEEADSDEEVADGRVEPVCLGDTEEADSDEEVAEDGQIESSWSLAVGDLCATTAHEGLEFFGVSRDGRRLSLPCQGTDFFWFGAPQVNPNGILTLILPPGESPRDLTQVDASPLTGGIVRRFQPIPGGGMGSSSVHRVQGDHASGLMTWRAGELLLVWDVDRGGWGARASLRGVIDSKGANLLGADPNSRRIYLHGGEDIPSGHLFRMDMLNLPGILEEDPVDVGLEHFLTRLRTRGLGTFDPRTRRLVVPSDNRVRTGEPRLMVLEDRTLPPASRVELHPDRRTTDIDEELASSVDRTGETAAYGARVWWTGLDGSLPGTYCVNRHQNGSRLDIGGDRCGTPPPGLTYEDLQDTGLSSVPWQPYRDQRELFSARVEKGVLESSDSALGFSSGLSEGEAWGLDTDGREGETGGTGEDIRSRRSTRDWHGRDEFAEFDGCFEEFHDRLLREVDGDRRVHPAEPCFGQFDEGDPHWSEDTGQNERPGLEQHLGLTQASRCVDRGGEGGEVSTTGSRVVCDEVGQSTVATADNALSTTLPGGISLDIDGSFSETNVFRDERGVVSEAVGVASGVRLEIAEVGRLEIGEVLTQATTWADGRPGGAGSKYTVAYKDVRVSAGFGPDGAPGDVVVFSCDPNEETAVVAGDPVGQDDAGSICDPEGLSDAIASVFGPRVTVRVPERDRDEIAEGTPGGAQAIVRRHRNDFYNDRILFHMTRDELPGLTIEINADGTMANRMRIDLAAVYAESRYNIGDLAAPHAAPAFVEAPMADLRNTATVQVALTDPSGSPLEGGTFELAHEGGLAAGCSTNAAGGCELTPLPLGSYDLFQTQAPPGYIAADPIGFELSQPGQVARIAVVNGRGGRDGSEVIEIIEILDDARPAVASDDAGGWWRRAARGLADVILRNPWVAVALALVISIVAAPGYLAARRRELSQMRELT